MKLNLSFFIVSIFFLSSTTLSGQKVKNNAAFRFGISANGLLSIKNWQPFQTGLGNEFQLWLEKPINQRHSLELSVAHRQLKGFQEKSVALKEFYFPNEFQSRMQTKKVASLDYLDANINWSLQIQKDRPWFFGLGIRVAYLSKWEANEQQTIWVADNNIRVTETWISGSTDHYVAVNESSPLAADNFNRLDYGLQTHFAFEISRGLRLKASYYQGFNKVFRTQLLDRESSYRVATFSLGLSARLF